MTLEPNFIPPDESVSKKETEKRLKLIQWFAKESSIATTGLLVSGSMGYGQNFSIKETSDIDMQPLVTPETVDRLVEMNVFDEGELRRAIEGYKKGYYSQFSLVFTRDEVNLECHFWDEQAMLDAISYKSASTPRLRSSTETPSTDHGFSFARQESIRNYYGVMIGGYAVSEFPSYRREDGVLYLCRPITNVLGSPIIVRSNPRLDQAISVCWQETIKRLVEYAGGEAPNLSEANIENTLPGKNKMREDILFSIRDKTETILAQMGSSSR